MPVYSKGALLQDVRAALGVDVVYFPSDIILEAIDQACQSLEPLTEARVHTVVSTGGPTYPLPDDVYFIERIAVCDAQGRLSHEWPPEFWAANYGTKTLTFLQVPEAGMKISVVYRSLYDWAEPVWEPAGVFGSFRTEHLGVGHTYPPGNPPWASVTTYFTVSGPTVVDRVRFYVSENRGDALVMVLVGKGSHSSFDYYLGYFDYPYPSVSGGVQLHEFVFPQSFTLVPTNTNTFFIEVRTNKVDAGQTGPYFYVSAVTPPPSPFLDTWVEFTEGAFNYTEQYRAYFPIQWSAMTESIEIDREYVRLKTLAFLYHTLTASRTLGERAMQLFVRYDEAAEARKAALFPWKQVHKPEA